ncbi:unnamed protein product [Heterobilharzia americana]|nr:unnamed protein product [Heterobilharzia americana]
MTCGWNPKLFVLSYFDFKISGKTNLSLPETKDSNTEKSQPTSSDCQIYQKLGDFHSEIDKSALAPSPPSRPPRPTCINNRPSVCTPNSPRPPVPLPQAPTSTYSEELYELVDDGNKKPNVINRFSASFRVITDKKINSLVSQFGNHQSTPGYGTEKVSDREKGPAAEKCSNKGEYQVDETFINYANKFCDKLDEQELKRSLTNSSNYLQPNSSKIQSKNSFKDSCSLFNSTSNLSIKSQSGKKFKQIKCHIIELFEKKNLPKIGKYSCALHINPDETVKSVVKASKTCSRWPVRPLPYLVLDRSCSQESDNKITQNNFTISYDNNDPNQSHSHDSVDNLFEFTCRNPNSWLSNPVTSEMLKDSMDLREAGLLDIREGEKLEVMCVFMEPRLLVRNTIGHYGLKADQSLGYKKI